MKVLKKVKNPYIEANKRRNLIFFALSVVLSICLFGLGAWLTLWLFTVAWVPLAISSIFIKRYRIWSAGGKGEQAVARSLRKLDDSHYLLSAVVLPGGKGDIDHILLGPKGVFAIEVKNYSGTVMCNEDEWHRRKRGTTKTIRAESVSAQVKRNALDLSDFLQRTTRLRLYVSPVCVFVNPSVQLELKNPTVPVLRLDELTRFIQNAQPSSSLSEKQLKDLRQSILKA